MSSYLEHLKKTVAEAPRRAASIVGDTVGSRTVSTFLAPADVEDGLGTIVGAAAGALIGKRRKHWLLGAIEGASLGRNLPALLHPDERRLALSNLGETTFAVACSVAAPKHPAAAFVVAKVAARVVAYATNLRGQ